MARNRLAGTKTGKSKSAKYYQSNPEARDKKQRYDAEFNKHPKQQKHRSILQAINRKKGTHGNLDGIDEAHVTKNKTKAQKQSQNRSDKKRIFFRVKS
jgi:hypothetical protein